MNIYQINMNEFDEIHSMTLQDIKEICTYISHLVLRITKGNNS